MRYNDNRDGIAKWVEEFLSPALANMPGGSVKRADYIDLSAEKRGQYIKITYDNGFTREANVSGDSASACILDLVNQHVIK